MVNITTEWIQFIWCCWPKTKGHKFREGLYKRWRRPGVYMTLCSIGHVRKNKEKIWRAREINYPFQTTITLVVSSEILSSRIYLMFRWTTSNCKSVLTLNIKRKIYIYTFCMKLEFMNLWYERTKTSPSLQLEDNLSFSIETRVLPMISQTGSRA